MEQLMPFKKWFLLLLLEISYLLLGACFFYRIESVEEAKRIEVERVERAEIEELLIFHYQPTINASQEEIFQKLTDYCGKPMHTRMSHDEVAHRWDFYHSLFFVITVVSTIGYGNLAPTTMLGRIVMIFYGLVGIPVNGIVMVNLGGMFGSRLHSYYSNWKNGKIHNMTANLGLLTQIILYLLPGFLLFVFLPSVVIMIFEGWDYDVAVYYAFVTLTTIGFGDYVAGVQDNHFGTTYFTTYKIFLLVWIIIGLGYVVMVLGFISRGMRSKKIQEMEQLLVNNIRQTPLKFKALKSMVYEILLMRLKPVYKKHSIAPICCDGRSSSLPDLRLLYADFQAEPCRKRALSETNTQDLPGMQRGHSDSNLHLIDKDLTFRSKKEQEQHALYRKMSAFVNSFEGKLNRPEERQLSGIDGFSPEEILESEVACAPPTPSLKLRPRSDSAYKLTPYWPHSNEVTWSGQTAAIKEQELREIEKHGRARSRTLPVQQEPLLKLPQVGLFSKLRRRFISTDSYREKEGKDVERCEFAGQEFPKPEVTRFRVRTQSEGFPSLGSNIWTDEEQKEVEQMCKWLSTLVGQDDAGKRAEEVSPPRCRRVPIVPMVGRKGSLMPPSPGHLRGGGPRRFSLNPVDDPLPPISPALVAKQRRFSLRPQVSISNTPSPVHRRMRKDNKDSVIIEHEQMK